VQEEQNLPLHGKISFIYRLFGSIVQDELDGAFQDDGEFLTPNSVHESITIFASGRESAILQTVSEESESGIFLPCKP
jgi:hypothetical protein